MTVFYSDVLGLAATPALHLLSRLAYRLTRCAWSPWKNILIRLFVWKYRVDLRLAEKTRPGDYDNFNDFFTRAMQPEARPIAEPGVVVSPVDGYINAAGTLDNERLLQAKGKHYSLVELFNGDRQLADCFRNGSFITFYLSPRDYHRVHLPAEGELRAMAYVPGRLLSVNPGNVRRIDKLYARNERVITVFDSAIGAIAVIFVGAIFVGSIATVWHGEVAPAGAREYRRWDYDPAVSFARGDEIGRFNMGSTVILLTQEDRISRFYSDRRVVMGERITA